MDEWLKNYGPNLGNALLSGIGLAFAIGAPAIDKFRLAKKWWIVLWAGLFGNYLGNVMVSNTLIYNIPASILLGIFNGITTTATAMLWLQFSGKQLPRRKLVIICTTIFLAAMQSAFLVYYQYSLIPFSAGLTSKLLDWTFFMLLAWSYRKQHMSTTILLLAYANLQLPAGLIGKEGWGNDLLLLIAAKLSLIGAMYRTLGIHDADNKAI